MHNHYSHDTSDFELSTAKKRKNLRKIANQAQQTSDAIIHDLHIDKHAVTTVDEIIEASDVHEEEVTDAFDQWKKS